LSLVADFVGLTSLIGSFRVEPLFVYSSRWWHVLSGSGLIGVIYRARAQAQNQQQRLAHEKEVEHFRQDATVENRPVSTKPGKSNKPGWKKQNGTI
jgi:hypothetical protein